MQIVVMLYSGLPTPSNVIIDLFLLVIWMILQVVLSIGQLKKIQKEELREGRKKWRKEQ